MEKTNTITHLEIETTSKMGGKQFTRGEYTVFTPQNFSNIMPENMRMPIEKIFIAGNRFQTISKSIQAVALLIYPVAMLAITSTGFHSTITCAGCVLMIMFSMYFGLTLKMFFQAHYKGNYLYRVYSLNGIIPNWTEMSVCYRAIQFPYNPIESISEFSAIHGGMGQIYLFSIGLFSWCVLLVSFFTQLQFNDKFEKFGISEICEVIGCYGLLLIGIFELDPFNKFMIMCHYTGALLGFCTVIGFNYQQFFIYSKLNSISVGGILYHVVLPIALDIGLIIGYCSWMYFGCKAKEYGKKLTQERTKNNNNNNSDNDRISLNKLALANVCCEALFLIVGAYSMCLYLISYEDFLDYV